MRKTTGLLVALGTLWINRAGTAEADTICGYNQPFVDASNGYLITSRSHDTVAKSVINTLGEYYTHTMLSHGFGWFTHSTMRVPDTFDWDPPHLSSIRLRDGQPGVSQISADATYLSLYGNDNGGVDAIVKRSGGNDGAAVADYFWNSMPYRWDPGGFWRLQWWRTYYNYTPGHWEPTSDDFYTCPDGCPIWVEASESYGQQLEDIPYSLVQYANINVNNGKVCSTLMAYGVKNALGRTIAPKQYSHAATANALNALYSKVFGDCKNKGQVAGIIIAFVTGPIGWFIYDDTTDRICGEIGNQVANCFVDPSNCHNYASVVWTRARDAASTAAYTISPDRISTYRSGGTSCPDYCYCSYGDPDDPYCTDYVCVPGSTCYTTPNNSAPWADHATSPLTFSGGGNTYSCWASNG
jgi:hypothetical protein